MQTLGEPSTQHRAVSPPNYTMVEKSLRASASRMGTSGSIGGWRRDQENRFSPNYNKSLGATSSPRETAHDIDVAAHVTLAL